MRFVKVSLIVLIFVLLTCSRCLSLEKKEQVLHSELTTSLLEANWEKVYNLLLNDDSFAEKPVARLLLAHACLATNRNNLSLRLLLSVNYEPDLESWSEWANALRDKNSNNPIAHYLAGDAKARLGKFEDAKKDLNLALSLQPNLALAYNARGLLYTLTGASAEAVIDFIRATEIAPGFADAQASLGTYWVLNEAPDGALEAFNEALTINPDFALALNGRGCAFFGKGDYDSAIDDMEKAFELASSLLPSLSNQGMILAVLATTPTTGKSNRSPGITFIARNELEKFNYIDIRTMDEMSNFHESLNKLAKTDPISAIRVTVIQLAKVENRITELTNTIAKMKTTFSEADKLKRNIEIMDQALGLINIGGKTRQTVSDRTLNWSYFVDLGSKTSETISAILPEETASRHTAEVISRSLAHPIIGIERVGLYWLGKTAGAIGTFADMRYSASTAELTLRTHQYHNLKQEELGRLVAQAVKQGVDLRRVDVLGIRKIPIPNSRQSSIPQNFIAQRASLVQFNSLPNVITKQLEASAKSAHVVFAKKNPLVVIDGNTDAFRLGTMVRGLEEKGVQILPVPPGINAQSFARMVGADRILNITKESGTYSKIPQMHYSVSKPGGITQDMSHAHIDKGNWPVITFFGLLYGSGYSSENQKPPKGDSQ